MFDADFKLKLKLCINAWQVHIPVEQLYFFPKGRDLWPNMFRKCFAFIYLQHLHTYFFCLL